MRALFLSPLLLLAACSTPKPASTTIAPGSYVTTFEAARQALRDYRFELDRIDAHAGVITTRPKSTSGLATPWDSEQQTIGAEWEDLLNQQQRRVRIAFVPASRPKPATSPATPSAGPAATESQPTADQLPPDLLSYEGPLVVSVSAMIQRIERPGWRPDVRSISQTTFTVDPARDPKYNAYSHDLRADPDLAGALLNRITHLAALPAPVPGTTTASPADVTAPTSPGQRPLAPQPKPSITPAEAFGKKPIAPPGQPAEPNPNEMNSPPKP